MHVTRRRRLCRLDWVYILVFLIKITGRDNLGKSVCLLKYGEISYYKIEASKMIALLVVGNEPRTNRSIVLSLSLKFPVQPSFSY